MTAESQLPLAVLRAAIQRRVDETNLRDTAREIGIKAHSSLAKFLAGDTKHPQSSTIVKMRRWYHARSSTAPSIQRAEIERMESMIAAYYSRLPKSVKERELNNAFERIRKNADSR